MDDLRWSLLLIGILLVAGIYVWDRYRRRGARHADKDLDALDEALLESLEVGRQDEGDAVLREALGELNGLKGERDSGTVDMDDLRSLIPKQSEEAVEVELEDVAVATEEDASLARSEEPSAGDTAADLIVIMNVMAKPGKAFLGREVGDALEDLDMRYGDMQIFHHYGVGEMSVDEPVFSVANVLEPGVLKREELNDLSTPGLCLFMRLPGPLDGRVAFELMLNTGQRLADKLGGELHDGKRNALSLETIGPMRERIADFERQQLVTADE